MAQLAMQRQQTVDVFRALTIVLMIGVNDLAGVTGIPGWMQHAAADAGYMTLADLVFPAFLYIVGMSAYLSQSISAAKSSRWQRTAQTTRRSAVLVLLGVLMVNADSGYDAGRMWLPIHLWNVLLYLAIAGIWLDWPALSGRPRVLMRSVAVLLLLLLCASYVGQDGGTILRPQWWGILGLIGWAAWLANLALIWLSRRGLYLFVLALICSALWATLTRWLPSGTGVLEQMNLLTHTQIVLMGAASAAWLIRLPTVATARTTDALALQAIVLVLMVGITCYYFPISKIRATPSWGWISAAACWLAYLGLDLAIKRSWLSRPVALLLPAARHSLLLYLLPYLGFHLLRALGGGWPQWCLQADVAILITLGYMALLFVIVAQLDKRGWQLRI
ncbi:heparan-alpha-glucosaminide N-acetyltransferase domain-containing protein [Undibacterium rugosum]|uniref:heparan-alpha-glucosaminide N-acetyltransferase domain-containing protein n=1 Tax=Undibacterium rugosum TaxID=2762291 RepID=UPI001B81F219|nr:heparan-alpha-glucosaminide N-acetyltransferase domain-containing protein [Undibacterium rugosum]MBR7780014.1 DUF1624 domain-containing protein [Undibacterium rugosum]